MSYTKLLFIVILWLFKPDTGFAQPSGSFIFTITTNGSTSAGIYKSDGSLVRTLWSGVNYTAGTYTRQWDGRDDYGNILPTGNYTARVLSNNVNYEWEGVIGNSSANMTGDTKFHGFDIINCMAITGTTSYCGLGYNENNTSEIKFQLADPRNKTAILPLYHSQDQSSFQVATDGVNVYWAGDDSWANPVKHFVFATKVSDDTEVIFPAGNSYQSTYGRNYQSVIDLGVGTNPKSGMAVQKNHPHLFVSYRELNEIHVFNKTTGVLVQTLTSFSMPRQLAIDGNDDIWMISGSNTIAKYAINTDGSLTGPSMVLAGVDVALAVAVSPDNSIVVVADGGSSQQIKAFNNNTGAPVWIYGSPGGYSTDPAVANDKFYFSDIGTNIRNPFIAFQPDGSFWVSDPGNYRVQHFSANREYINRIMFLPHSYSVRLDKNNPTRLFNQYLEFAIDYSQPLDNGANGSWTLVKNWRAAIPPEYYEDANVDIFRSVTTLQNGRTYGLLINHITHKPAVVELPASGQVRFTGIEFDPYSNQAIYPDGSLRSAYGMSVGGTATWYQQDLTGFDGSHNPVWGSNQIIASTTETTVNDPLLNGPFAPLPGEKTSSDIIVSFNGSIPPGGSAGYHLGGIRTGDNKWLWKTAMTMPGGINNTEYWPYDGRFDAGNGIARAGGLALAIDRNIIWGYSGEFWRNQQVNKWNHVYDNGLFVGQFGVLGVEVFGQEAPAMMAGNSFTPFIVKVGTNYYLYHNDEFYHSGIHRWKISGLESILEQAVPVVPDVILPVTISSIKAYVKAPGIQVDWTVVAEVNINHYEVQKSLDGERFTTEGIVPANAGSATTIYSWFDANPTDGNNYYRIKPVDQSGIIKYSRIVNVKLNSSKRNFEVYPNPGDFSIIQFNNIPKGLYTVKLINSNGQLIFTTTIRHQGGSASQTIPVAMNIPAGVYNLQITGNGIAYNKQVVK